MATSTERVKALRAKSRRVEVLLDAVDERALDLLREHLGDLPTSALLLRGLQALVREVTLPR